jgi:hypothetical protein
MVCLFALVAVIGLVLAAAGCGSAPKKPDVEKPEVEEPEKPAEDGTEKPEEGEKPEPAEKPEEGETELEKQAKAELAAAIGKAKELEGQKEFGEALAVLNAVIEKYKGSPVVEGAKELLPGLEAAKVEEEQRLFLEEAKSAFNGTIENCNKRLAQRQFREALKILRAFPEKYERTEYKARIDIKLRQVQGFLREWEERQAKLREAEKQFREIEPKVLKLTESKKYVEALKLLESYPEEYSETESAKKVTALWNGINDEKQAYDRLQERIDDTGKAYDGRIEEADSLVEAKKFGDAVKLLEDFYEEFQAGFAEFRDEAKFQGEINNTIAEHKKNLERDIVDIKEDEEQYKEQVYQKKAKEAFESLIAEADGLVEKKEFDKAVEKLGKYPEEYKPRTRWSARIAAKVEEVKQGKQDYEDYQALLKKAEDEATKVISKARELANKSEFDKAVQRLRKYPAEYREKAEKSHKRVTEEIKKIEERKTSYEKRRMTMGIVIAVVIVILLVVVLAISFGKKGKKGGPPSLGARMAPPPAPEIPEKPQEFIEEAQDVEPEEEPPPGE